MRSRDLTTTPKPRPAPRRLPAVAAMITALAAVALAATAQPPPPAPEPATETLLDLPIEALLELKVQTVVGASKHEQDVRWAPSSVTVVDRRQIQDHGYRTLVDVLTGVAGFYATYDRNYTYLGVRGFNRPGDYNSRVLLLVNGHRLNDNVYDAAALGTDFPLDVDLIERVEVVRGPSSSLYGSNAFFAVVNVITRSGAEVDGWELAAEGGSFATSRGRLSWGRRLPSGAEVLVSGSLYDRAGPDLFFPEFADPETNDGLAIGVDDDRFESVYATATTGRWAFQGGYVRRDKTIPTGSFEVEFNDPRNHTVDGQWFVETRYSRAFANRLELLARWSYDRYDYSGEYVYDEADDGDQPDLVVNRDRARGEWWGGELSLARRFGPHRLAAGVEYRDNLRQNQSNFDREVFLDDRRDSDVPAFFVQSEIRLRQTLRLDVGLRHDRYRSFGSTTNPRLALIYRPTERSAWKLLYGEAFRAPNHFELFYSDGDFSQKANPDLDAEDTRTLELVWEKDVGQRLRASVSAYRYRVDNLISQQLDPLDELLVYRNAGEVEAEGVELELHGRCHGGIEGSLSASFQTTDLRASGEPLTSSPEQLAKFRLALPLWQERLRLAVETRFTGERRTLAGATLGSFTTTHLTLRAPRVVPRLELSAHVDNLFDKAFSLPAAGEHLQDAIAQDGRGLRLKAIYRF